MEEFKTIDHQLKKYYESMGRKDYENANGVGKFLEYCIENQFEPDDITDELSVEDPSECMYLEFDDDFPFENEITDEEERQKIIFNIIKKCHNKEHPKNLSKAKWNMELTNEEYNNFKQIYAKHCTQTAKTKIDDQTFWWGLCLSFKNNFPLLQFLSQIYIRECIQHMLQNEESDFDLNTFINETKNNIMKLCEPNKSIKIFDNDEKEQTVPVIQFIQSAINSYSFRLLPSLNLPLPIGFAKIDDNIKDIANVISSVSTFCQREEMCYPFQMDCVIACNVKDEAKENKCVDNIGNILTNLQNNNCAYHMSDKIQQIYTSKRINITFNDFKQKMKNKYKDIDAKYMNNYPQRRRIIIFIDNRKNIGVLNNDKIENIKNKNIKSVTFFEATFDVREYPNYKQNTNSIDISEWCIEATRTCIIPCIGYPNLNRMYGKDKSKYNLLKTKNALTHCNGQLITFSFHIEQQNNIRCYMWWRGKCILFLPQDINDVLPHIFVRSNGFKFDGYDVCQWRDEMFEAIYQNVTHKDPIEQLRKYHQ